MQANQKRSDCMQQLSDSGLALMKIVRTAGSAAPYTHITAEPAQAGRSWRKNTVLTPLSLSGSAVIPALLLCGPALRPGDRSGGEPAGGGSPLHGARQPCGPGLLPPAVRTCGCRPIT